MRDFFSVLATPLDSVVCIACLPKAKSFNNKEICEQYKVKYTDQKVHYSTQTNDREEEGISVTMYLFF